MIVDTDFLRAVLELGDEQEAARLFNDLFTPAELADLTLRWKLLKDLHRGMTQRKIAEKYGISLCKITRGSKVLKKDGSVALKLLDSRN